MTEEKAQYNTAPADLNELKQRIEERGEDWTEALATLKVGTGGKNIAAAIQEGWTVEGFWKLLQAVEREPEPIQAPKEDPATPIPMPAPQNGFTEAPASFNVKAISPAGFNVQLTLRDTNATQLWERAQRALQWLADNKFTPTSARNSGGGGNGPCADAGNGSKYCDEKRDDPGFCPVHGKEMKRSQFHAGYYCPTKL